MIIYISFCFNTYRYEGMATIEMWLPYPPTDYICRPSIINGLVRAIFDILDWFFFCFGREFIREKEYNCQILMTSLKPWRHQM